MLFPKIFIFSTKSFSVSSILKFKFKLSSTNVSSTLALIDLYSSFKVILSISSSISSTVFIEYGLPFKSFNNIFNSLKLLASKSSGIFNEISLKKILFFASILNINSNSSLLTNLAKEVLISTL